jgi:predicted porin
MGEHHPSDSGPCLTLEKLAMKKSLIALAAFAATASFAQSSVTIYGKADLGVARSIGSSVTELKQASGSRLGFRGTEDLGGGLKANFQIENRFLPDTGAAADATTFFNGRSIVGIEGGFGRIDMGRDYTAAFWTALGGDVFGYDGVAANSAVAGAGNQTVRFNNVISYKSPTMGGLTLEASSALKEAGAKNGSSVRISYASGPIAASIATEKGQARQKFNGFGAAYDLGVARVNALISKGETAAGVESEGMLLGLTVPMGALSLKASYGTLEVGSNKTVQQMGLGARYALSKRTDLYTSYANNSKAAAGTKKNGMEFGMQHNF